MLIGVHLPTTQPAGVTKDALVGFAQEAERPYLEPVVALAAAAAVTTRARLGGSVFILGHRHPVVIAKMLASLDALSGGRLIVGVGVGWWKQEMEILGVPFDRRGRDGDEAIQVFKTPWTQDAPAFDGARVHFKDIGFEPKPLQRLLLEFRRDTHQRMFEILDLVTGTIRPAVDAA